MTNKLEVALYIFVIASFLGFTVITKIPGLLHTPLMSLTNALSAIAIVGSLILAGDGETTMATILGSVAVFASFTNIVSGFMLTDRMVRMFKRREAPSDAAAVQKGATS
ncbi:MAG TPA: NAD(P) transhydrogenase subunit alpha [Actinomycetota bacterium]